MAEQPLMQGPAEVDEPGPGEESERQTQPGPQDSGFNVTLFVVLLCLRVSHLIWAPFPGLRARVNALVRRTGGAPDWSRSPYLRLEALQISFVLALTVVYFWCTKGLPQSDDQVNACRVKAPYVVVAAVLEAFSILSLSLRDSICFEELADAIDVRARARRDAWESALDSGNIPNRGALRTELVVRMRKQLRLRGVGDEDSVEPQEGAFTAAIAGDAARPVLFETAEYAAQLRSGKFTAEAVAAQVLVTSSLEVAERSTRIQTASVFVVTLLQLFSPLLFFRSSSTVAKFDEETVISVLYGLAMGTITLTHGRAMQRAVAVFSERRQAMRAVTAMLSHESCALLPLPKLDLADARTTAAYGRIRLYIKHHAEKRMWAASLHISMLIVLVALLVLVVLVEFALSDGSQVLQRLFLAATMSLTCVGVAVSLIVLISSDVNRHAHTQKQLLLRAGFLVTGRAVRAETEEHRSELQDAVSLIQALADMQAAEGTFCTFFGIQADGTFVAKIISAVLAAWAAQAFKEEEGW